jgi:hypothetical protein
MPAPVKSAAASAALVVIALPVRANVKNCCG